MIGQLGWKNTEMLHSYLLEKHGCKLQIMEMNTHEDYCINSDLVIGYQVICMFIFLRKCKTQSFSLLTKYYQESTAANKSRCPITLPVN